MEDFVLGDAKSAGNPRDRREESAETESRAVVVAAVARALALALALRFREAARKVDGGVGGPLLEDGEEGEDENSQPYVYGR